MIVFLLSIEAKSYPQDLCAVATDVDASFYAFITRFEGIYLKPYNDLGHPVKYDSNGNFVRPTRGLLHIGIGHKLTNDEIKSGKVKINGILVDIRKKEITQYQAIKLLDQDLVFTKSLIKRHIKTDLTQNQYNAITSYLFNRAYYGLYIVEKGKIYTNKPTKFLKFLNKHQHDNAINNMGNLKHPMKGIRIRRKAERELARRSE